MRLAAVAGKSHGFCQDSMVEQASPGHRTFYLHLKEQDSAWIFLPTFSPDIVGRKKDHQHFLS